VLNLSADRFNSHDERTNVGHCLKNIHPDLEDTWYEFCAQRTNGKYDPREVNVEVDGFNFATTERSWVWAAFVAGLARTIRMDT
jgi:hypothetical protein